MNPIFATEMAAENTKARAIKTSWPMIVFSQVFLGYWLRDCPAQKTPFDFMPRMMDFYPFTD